MKKKFMIPIAVVVLIVLGVVGVVLCNHNDGTESIITLDINPSIEIHLNKNEKAKSVIALNEDAKTVVTEDMKNKSIEEAIELLVINTIEHGYINVDETTDIILYTKGSISSEEVKNILEHKYLEQKVATNVIVIESVSKEDEELAEKYHTSPAKIAYIHTYLNENINLSIEDLASKSVKEMEQMRDTGSYCEEGYTLEEEWCEKEVSRVSAQTGDICPHGSYEYNEKCYILSNNSTKGEYYCADEDATLVGNTCVRTDRILPNRDGRKCETGTLMSCAQLGIDAKDMDESDCYFCVDESKLEVPVYDCVQKIDGRCYGGASKPYMDGQCMNGDLEYNGRCYEYRREDSVCSNGKRVQGDKYCPDSIVTTEPQPANESCENGYQLVGEYCERKVENAPFQKVICETGYILVDHQVCIDLSSEVSKIKGYYCEDESTRLDGNECIVYERKEVNHF